MWACQVACKALFFPNAHLSMVAGSHWPNDASIKANSKANTANVFINQLAFKGGILEEALAIGPHRNARIDWCF